MYVLSLKDDGVNRFDGTVFIHPLQFGPIRVIKCLYSLAPPPPTVWALDLPTIHLVKVTRGLVWIKYILFIFCSLTFVFSPFNFCCARS
jgi:hypothetical protein